MTTTTTVLPNPDDHPDHDARVLPFRHSAAISVPGSTTIQNSGDTCDPRGMVVGPVIDAELVDDDRIPPRSAGSVVALRPAAGAPVLARTARLVGAVGAVVRSDRTRTTARVGAMVTVTTGLGFASWLGRLWDAATMGVYRRQIRSAEAAGDYERLREWTDARELAAERRHHRLMELPRVAVGLVQVTVGTVLGLGLFWLLLGLLAHLAGVTSFVTVMKVVPAVIRFVGAVIRHGWLPVLITAPLLVLVAAFREGRRRGTAPRWLTKVTGTEVDSWVDERAISQALAHLGVGPLNAFFKAGGELVYTVPARVDGDGTGAQIRLPMGVTAEMVADRRDRLAAGLGRATLEVWPTTGDEAGLLDLWVADKGKLNTGAGEWPFLHDGQVDVFQGVPIGRAQRGNVIDAPVIASNWLIGGRPGQGKSAALRTLLLGAALDPTCELWVSVMGESPDFEPFRPRLARYAMGMDDSVAADTTQALRDLLTEMERRGKVLGAQPGRPPKVSRKLANKPALGLHPLLFVIDECHELFMHREHGKEAADLAVRLIKRGRKYGIVLALATQSPTKDSIPREVTRNVSTGVAFAVSDHVANDGLLGAGKYKAGVRATDLRMHTDRGTSVAVGVTDATFELVRWFYIPFEDGHDAVSPVVARAVALMDEHGRRAIPTTGPADDAPVVDPLADIAEVIGAEKRLRTQVVLSRLAELRPEHYEGWSPADLADALAEHEVSAVKSHGVMVIRATDVTDALTRRTDDEDLTDAGDDSDDAELFTDGDGEAG